MRLAGCAASRLRWSWLSTNRRPILKSDAHHATEMQSPDNKGAQKYDLARKWAGACGQCRSAHDFVGRATRSHWPDGDQEGLRTRSVWRVYRPYGWCAGAVLHEFCVDGGGS